MCSNAPLLRAFPRAEALALCEKSLVQPQHSEATS